MNPEMPDINRMSAEALRDLLNNLTQAKQFAIEQAPEFCQQIVARGMILPAVTGFLLLAFAILATAVFVWGVVLHLRGSKSGSIDKEIGGVATAVVSFMAGILLWIGAVHHLYSSLSVYIAPKVYLVEEITRMIK